jgi:hypothetical protein
VGVGTGVGGWVGEGDGTPVAVGGTSVVGGGGSVGDTAVVGAAVGEGDIGVTVAVGKSVGDGGAVVATAVAVMVGATAVGEGVGTAGVLQATSRNAMNRLVRRKTSFFFIMYLWYIRLQTDAVFPFNGIQTIYPQLRVSPIKLAIRFDGRFRQSSRRPVYV